MQGATPWAGGDGGSCWPVRRCRTALAEWPCRALPPDGAPRAGPAPVVRWLTLSPGAGELGLYNKRKALVASVGCLGVSAGGELAGWSAERTVDPDAFSCLRLLLVLPSQQPSQPQQQQPQPQKQQKQQKQQKREATHITLMLAVGAAEEISKLLSRASAPALLAPPTPPPPRRLASSRLDSLDMTPLPSSSLTSPGGGLGREEDSSSSESEPESSDESEVQLSPPAEPASSAADTRLPSVLRSGAGRRTAKKAQQRQPSAGRHQSRSKHQSTIQLVPSGHVRPFVLSRDEVQGKKKHILWIQRLRQNEQQELEHRRPAEDECSDSDDEITSAANRPSRRGSDGRDSVSESSESDDERSSSEGDEVGRSPDNKNSSSSSSEDGGSSTGSEEEEDGGDDDWSD